MPSTLLIPEAIALSFIILNCHSSDVFLTCVPPHNSYELPNFIVLTTSPYFSPNNPMAPLSKAFFIGTFLFSSRAMAFSILELTKFSTATISFRSSFEK